MKTPSQNNDSPAEDPKAEVKDDTEVKVSETTEKEDTKSAEEETEATENSKSDSKKDNHEEVEELCKSCQRPLSKKTGECYYCKEVDKEAEKNLSMIMLDWQHEAASDPDARKQQSTRKVLSLVLVLQASACIAFGTVPNIDPFYGAHYHWIAGLVVAFCCWSFYFNSLTALTTIVLNLGVTLFYMNIILKAIADKLFVTAFTSGLVVSMACFSLFLIIARIFKTKTIEL